MRIRRAARTLLALGLFAILGGAPLTAAAQQKPAAGAAKPKPGAPAKPAPKPGAKPGHKAAPAPAKLKKGVKRASRKAGEAGEPDEATRRIIAGTAGRTVRESHELRAMRELDLALFPARTPGSGPPWIAEGSPLVALLDRNEPRVTASGLPPSTPLATPAPEKQHDLSWLRNLTMPDIPVRWDARVVRYLEYYKNNPRGRSMVASWIKKSGRYGGSIRRVLREQNLPEDILWLALVESGFDPTISSPVGAAGLWQFMPEGARIYGLTVDRWIDERLDPERSTLAAARYLADLRQRFGGWELAFAAYNMGYGGLLSSIRKYNTNDFWELSRLEAGMPLETALYVPKIVAMAIVSRNKAIFGCDDVELEAAAAFDKIAVSSGVSLRHVALAAGTSVERVEELNPQMLASRAPPLLPGVHDDATWTVRVPPGTAPKAAKSLAKLVDGEAKLDRYIVRWGESLDEIAARRRITRGTLMSLNGLRRDEVMRPGTVLFVPAGAPAAADPAAPKPLVIVPAQTFAYPDRARVFYRVVPGDTLRDLGALFGVTVDDLATWNALDSGATLHDGMTLQVFPPKGRTPANALVLPERDAQVLPVGSPAFFAHFEGLRGRKRLELVAKQGDTWRTVAHKYGLSVAQLERINGRGRSTALAAGDRFIVYVPASRATDASVLAPAKPEKQADAPPDEVAVAKPIGDEPKEEGLVKPAVLKRDAEAADAPAAPPPDKPAPP